MSGVLILWEGEEETGFKQSSKKGLNHVNVGRNLQDEDRSISH